MARIQCIILKSFYFILIVNCVFGSDSKFNPIFFNIDRILYEVFTDKSDFNHSQGIIESMSLNWTANHDCFIQLDAIERGVRNLEEWSMMILDSWGKIPAGIMSGNYFDLGAFSQCFHIKQNDTHYPTQYCIGQFKFPTNETRRRSTPFPK